MKQLFFFLLLFRSLPLWAAEDPAPGLKFIENKRQWPRQVHFAARVPGGDMVLEAGRFRYRLLDEASIEMRHQQAHRSWKQRGPEAEPDEILCGHAVDATFIGSNTGAQPQPFGRSEEYYNFFLGSDSTSWASGAYAYDGVIYSSLYTGVDLKVYSQGEHLKYDFFVAAGADPAQIRWQYTGADGLTLDNGNLTVKTSLGDLIERKPYAYQWIDGKKVAVPCHYELEDHALSFVFPEGYDACYPLVIDPILIFSTYSGSTADNWGSTATPGPHGTLYSGGNTRSVLGGFFPATAGSFQTSFGGVFDMSVIKYDSTGRQMLYASYIGGRGADTPHSFLTNEQDELLVLGTTSSDDYPIIGGVVGPTFKGGPAINIIGIPYSRGSDIVLTRIRDDGRQILASTYLGGTGNDGLNPSNSELQVNYGDEMRGDIAADADGNVYVSTVTSSDNFPLEGGLDDTYNLGKTDAVVLKLDAGLTTMLWGTYIGGDSTDASHTIKLDPAGNVYVGGGTASKNFPGVTGALQDTLDGEVDGWIAKLDPTGHLLQATYTGTDNFDQVYCLDLNKAGEIYVYGQTDGVMNITPGLYGNANTGQFLRKFSNDLTTLLFTTTFGFGREPNISPTAFLVSDCNTIYMSGWGGLVNDWRTDTKSMDTTPDAYQRSTEGSDFYFIVLAEDASKLLYATYMGGTQSGTHVDGGTSRFDKEGVVYHSVCAGCAATTSNGKPASDFPTTPGAWSRLNGSGNCNNAAFKFDLSSLKARVAIKGNSTVCLPDRFRFTNLSSGGEIYFWNFGDGSEAILPDTVSIEHAYAVPGEYTIRLVARDPATCINSDTAYVKVRVFEAAANAQDDDHLCGGSSYQLHIAGTAGVGYHWYTKDRTFTSNVPNPVVKPDEDTEYFVDITEASGCMHTDAVTIDVTPEVKPEFEYNRIAGCLVRPYITVRNLTDSLMEDDEIFYDFGDGTTSTTTSDIDHFYEKDSLYTVRQTITREGCVYQEEIEVPVFSITIPNVITPGNKDGDNDYFVIRFGRGEAIKTPADYGFNTSVAIYNRWGEEVYRNPEYHFDWSAESLAAGVYYFEVEVAEHAKCKSWIHVIK